MASTAAFLSRAAESVASACARTYLLLAARRADVRFRVLRDEGTLERVGALRKSVYSTAHSAYLLAELDANGLDEFDRRATAFIAEDRGAAGETFAAIRTLRHPFEVLRFVSPEFLADKLGTRDNARVIEVSRLVSSRPSRKVTNSLVLFGGVYLALHGVTRYFAYVAVPEHGSPHPPADTFRIPHRRSGDYVIMSGSIARHAARIGPRLWRSTKSSGSAPLPRDTKRA
ncbi:hypothetical protein [Ramlibacter sp.]|uniref:hypothetical protein n=1 Tax=Ramlibacter sp. TaxID=1917967 RepID=UPI0017E806E3|nr:hypothetical protein [Ramlibacter sp.]MBA2672400.1 hypothetical protein [Ramlibacter sp.]